MLTEITQSVPIFTIKETFDLVKEPLHLKPCRRCYEKRHEIIIPIFYWFDESYEMVNWYRVECPHCKLNEDYSGVAVEWHPEKAEKKWNDWSGTVEDWETKLDW